MLIAHIHLAGKPMAKERVRFTRSGHAYAPERTVNYEGRLAAAGQIAMEGKAPTESALSVDLQIGMPITASWSKKKREAAAGHQIYPVSRPDLDNYAKMLDALNLIVWVDDSQIVDLIVTKRYSVSPGLTIVVRTLDDESIFD